MPSSSELVKEQGMGVKKTKKNKKTNKKIYSESLSNLRASFSRQGLELLFCKFVICLQLRKVLFNPEIKAPKNIINLQLKQIKQYHHLKFSHSYQWICSNSALNRICEISPSGPTALEVPGVQVDEVDNFRKLSYIETWCNRWYMVSQIFNWLIHKLYSTI